MLMPMVNIRKMWMGVFERFMSMAMLCACRVKKTVGEPVMFVVQILVSMFRCIMGVLMLMPFGKMKPDTKNHQGTGYQKRECYRLSHRDC